MINKLSSFNSKLKGKSFPFSVYIILVLELIAFYIISPGSVGLSHVMTMIQKSAMIAVAAMGQTVVLLIGGMDLSIGAQMSLTNIVLTMYINNDPSKIFPGLLIAFGLCLIIGFLNGLVVSKLNIEPFLVTMAMATIIEGGYFVYTKGIQKGAVPKVFRVLTETWVGPFPTVGLILLAIWIVLSLVIRKTVFGQRLYMVGGNKVAAKLSGINSDKYIIMAYMLSSLLACMGGVLLTSYIGVCSIACGDAYQLTTIAATVIGGTSFVGGVGSVDGTFGGVMILTVITSLLTMLGISEGGKLISQGLIIIIMLSFQQKALIKDK